MAGKESGNHGPNESLSPAQRLKHFNGMLVFIMMWANPSQELAQETDFNRYLAFCAFNFGFDVGTFGGVQAMHSFTSMFGECDDKNVCALPGWLSSVMTATPFLGKAAVYLSLKIHVFVVMVLTLTSGLHHLWLDC